MPEEPKKFNGIELGKLVKWNSVLDRIKMDDGSPFIPFSNQIAFLRSKELEVLYGGGTRGGMRQPNTDFLPQNHLLYSPPPHSI